MDMQVISLTHISKADYNALLKDAEHSFINLQREYGAGLFLRMPGIITAFAVHDFNIGPDYKDARVLYNEIKMHKYVEEIFEENGFRVPGEAFLDSTTFSMCQAETGDYR